MRVLPTNTTTPRYNNKYIRVSSRNNFPPMYLPPPFSAVSLCKVVLRLSSCCVPQRSLINIAATELAGGFSSRSRSLPLPFANSLLHSTCWQWSCFRYFVMTLSQWVDTICVCCSCGIFICFFAHATYAQHSLRSKRKKLDTYKEIQTF